MRRNARRILGLPSSIVWITNIGRMAYHDVSGNVLCKPNNRHILPLDAVHKQTVHLTTSLLTRWR